MTATAPPAPEPTPQPGIDPAEALIVTAGLEPFLRHTSRDLRGAIVRSESMPDALEAQIYRFLGRGEAAELDDPPAFDYAETADLLNKPPAEGQIGKTMAAFGDHHGLAMSVGTEVTRIVTYLRQQLPKRTHVGLAGPEDLPPARSEEFRFRRCWRLAVEPMALLTDLQAFAVSRDQVTCFATMFPTTAAQLWPTVQRAIVRKRTQVDGWQPTRRQEVQLRILGRQEAPLLTLSRALAGVYAQEAQAQAAQKQGQPATKDVSQADEGTPTQRLDAAD